MEKLGLVVFIAAVLSLLMACGAIVWIAINFQKLMKVLAGATFDIRRDDSLTTNEQLISYIAVADAVRMKMISEEHQYDRWKEMPQRIRDSIESELQNVQANPNYNAKVKRTWL